MKIRIIAIVLLTVISGFSIFNKKEEVYVVSQSTKVEVPQIENKEVDEVIENEKYENNDENILKNDIINEEKNKIIIFLGGEVHTPQVITLEDGNRLIDAVNKIGGLTDDADLNRVNLAIKLVDEGHYIIPKIGEDIIEVSNFSMGNTLQNESNISSEASKVNINIASISELSTLPGIGEATSNKILSYREGNGNFSSIDELKNVNGVGDKKFEDIKNLVSID
ncbi:MAG: helix-hairpin-helix domain-containing protein [Peptostreptococcaceae bacterium]